MSRLVGSLFIITMSIDQVVIWFPNNLLKSIQSYNDFSKSKIYFSINPLTSPSAWAPALKYGDVNTVTPSPGEVKGLIGEPWWVIFLLLPIDLKIVSFYFHLLIDLVVNPYFLAANALLFALANTMT